MEKKSILLIFIRLALVALWVPVAVDKLWNLQEFHSTLLRQPFPDWWAGILFWLLPLLELLAAVLVAWPHGSSLLLAQLPAGGMRPGRASRSNLLPAYHPLRLGLWLSTILMFAFTLFILFGVLGWYEKRPCGCGSVISGLTWEQHLWFNITFLLLSAVGLWNARDKKHQTPPSNLSSRRQEGSRFVRTLYYKAVVSPIKTRFPRRFALFRRRADCVTPTLPQCYLKQVTSDTWPESPRQ